MASASASTCSAASLAPTSFCFQPISFATKASAEPFSRSRVSRDFLMESRMLPGTSVPSGFCFEAARYGS